MHRHKFVNTGFADDVAAWFRKHCFRAIAEAFLAARAYSDLLSCLIILFFGKVDGD